MNRLVRRQRAALALFIALTVSGVGVAMAAPQSGDQPGVTLDLTPHPPYASTQTVTVTGAGFQSGGVGTSGLVYQAATLPDGTTAVGLTTVQFTSNSQGTFTATLQVSPTFRASGSGGADFPVDCNATGVTCYVEATSNSGALQSRHPISFGSGTTVPTTVTTVPTTVTTVPTTVTTVPPTTPGGTLCDRIRAARAQLNAQIDAARTAIILSLPAEQQAVFLAQLEAIRAQGNAQLDALLVGCPAA